MAPTGMVWPVRRSLGVGQQVLAELRSGPWLAYCSSCSGGLRETVLHRSTQVSQDATSVSHLS